MLVLHELVDGHEFHSGHTEFVIMVDHRRMCHAGVGAAVLRWEPGMGDRQAAYVRLVDDRLVVRGARRAVPVPVEERADDHRLHHPGRGSPGVHAVGVAEVVAEDRLVPVDLAVDRLRVRVQKKLGRITPQPLGGFVRAVDPIPVSLAGADARQETVVDEGVGFLQFDPGLGVVLVEQAQLDLLGNLGEDREIGAGAIVGGTERIGAARPDLQHTHGAYGVGEPPTTGAGVDGHRRLGRLPGRWIPGRWIPVRPAGWRARPGRFEYTFGPRCAQLVTRVVDHKPLITVSAVDEVRGVAAHAPSLRDGTPSAGPRRPARLGVPDTATARQPHGPTAPQPGVLPAHPGAEFGTGPCGPGTTGPRLETPPGPVQTHSGRHPDVIQTHSGRSGVAAAPGPAAVAGGTVAACHESSRYQMMNRICQTGVGMAAAGGSWHHRYRTARPIVRRARRGRRNSLTEVLRGCNVINT